MPKCQTKKCIAYTKTKNRRCKLCISVEGKQVQLCWVHFRSLNTSQPYSLSKSRGVQENKWSLLLKTTEEIYGIVRFQIVHSREYNQTILLFGELHHKFEITECEIKTQNISTQPTRTYIRNYIEAIIRSMEDMFFDIYLERSLIIKEKKLQPKAPTPNAPNLIELEKLFSGCLEEMNGKKCVFPNVRVHASDARTLDLEKSSFYVAIIDTLVDKLRKRTKDFNKYEGSKPIFKVRGKANEDLFHPIKQNKHGAYDVNEILMFFHIDDKSYVFKEINLIDENTFNHKKNIKNRLLKELHHVRTSITDFYVNKAEKVLQVVENVYKYNEPKFVRKNYDFFINLENELEDLFEELVFIMKNIMDIYTLARIFHAFQSKTEEQKTKNFPKYASNIIYYAGADHIMYTLEMLKEFGFEEIYSTGSHSLESNACVKAPPFSKLQEKMITWSHL